MKLPRTLSGAALIKALSTVGYQVTRQKGSHIRITLNSKERTHHITIPNHDPLKIGTLSAILNDIASHLKMSKEQLVDLLFNSDSR